jgi:hypothetical protein
VCKFTAIRFLSTRDVQSADRILTPDDLSNGNESHMSIEPTSTGMTRSDDLLRRRLACKIESLSSLTDAVISQRKRKRSLPLNVTGCKNTDVTSDGELGNGVTVNKCSMEGGFRMTVNTKIVT